jgi:hypothetical protein
MRTLSLFSGSIRPWWLLVPCLAGFSVRGQEAAGPSAVLETDAGWRGRAGVQTWRQEEGARAAPYLMHRLRASVRFRPTDWLGAEAEFQDARSFDGDSEHSLFPFQDPLEVRVAKVRLGVEEGPGWRMELGRQSVSLGQERLIGSDSEWCNVSRSFDGVRGAWQKGRWRADGMAARVVGVRARQPDPVWQGEDVMSLGLTAALWGGTVEVGPQTIVAEVAAPEGGIRRLTTTGVVWKADLPRGGTWEGEAHWQRGADARAAAVATTWSVPTPWLRGEPEWVAGWMWGSGGGPDARGRTATFHDLYPAGHNGCGLLDPYAWRNLLDLMAGANWKMGRGWTGSWEDHTYWLASRQDGLYVDGGAPLWFAGPEDSRFAGHQTNVTFQHPWRRHMVATGVSWLHTGGFVRKSGGPRDAVVLFVSWEVKKNALP